MTEWKVGRDEHYGYDPTMVRVEATAEVKISTVLVGSLDDRTKEEALYHSLSGVDGIDDVGDIEITGQEVVD